MEKIHRYDLRIPGILWKKIEPFLKDKIVKKSFATFAIEALVEKYEREEKK